MWSCNCLLFRSCACTSCFVVETFAWCCVVEKISW